VDQAFLVIAITIFYFVIFNAPELIKSSQSTKLKIAEANRDAEWYRLETARINSNK
jgi:hypothetical protein